LKAENKSHGTLAAVGELAMLQMLGLRGGAGGGSPSAGDATPARSGDGDAAAGPARPLRLVYCDEKGKFVMDPEAVAALQLVKGPIGVVSVCGRARQGKSFVLNQVRARQGELRFWGMPGSGHR